MLAAFSLVIIFAFYRHMAPRFSYLTAGRAIADDPPCGRPECDFSVFWPAGRLAREHAYTALYTPQIFTKMASAMLRRNQPARDVLFIRRMCCCRQR